MPFSKSEIQSLKAFSQAIDADPSILFSKDLEFLRKSLSVYGDLTMPVGKTSAPSKSNHDDNAHSHAHEHSHGSCSHDHSLDEPEEEDDPERMVPDSEPYLSIPNGGEG